VSGPRIRIEDVSVSFPLYHGNARSLKKTVLAAASGRLGEDRQHRVVVQALREISFDLHGGDRLGLIGANGAGKTTLLRTLAGIYEPVTGRIEIRGRLNALLDASLGMNMELTGRENIMLRGLYSGLPRPALARLEDDVAEFAGLGDFLDLPVRIYSAGMMIRLGFALATAIRPEILVMDEWLSTGDEDFKHKADRRLREIVETTKILVLASHSRDLLRKNCNRILWMEHGRVRMDGPTNEVLPAYFG